MDALPAEERGLDSHLFCGQWGNGTAPPVPSARHPVIELVTSPNNPDGAIRQPAVASSPHRRVVMDHAYLWPHFTPTAQSVQYGDDTLAMFTLSKMTGHGSTRIG